MHCNTIEYITYMVYYRCIDHKSLKNVWKYINYDFKLMEYIVNSINNFVDLGNIMNKIIESDRCKLI